MPRTKKILIKSSTSTEKPKTEKSKEKKTRVKKEKSKEKKTRVKKEKPENNKPKRKYTKRKKIVILSSSSSPKKEKIELPLSQRTTVTDQIMASNPSQRTTISDQIMASNPSQRTTVSEQIMASNIDLKKSPEVSKIMEKGRLNEKFMELMEKLADIMLKQGEPFRARAYQKAQETIMAYPGDILSPDDLKGKPNIGPTIIEKLNEYIQTGTLKVIEREKNNPINILGEIYGVGPKKAKELVEKGITSIAQLREKQDLLNDVQKVGLRYYEDVLKRIPRAEIEEYNQIIKKILDQPFSKVKKESLDQPFSKVEYEIVGSYRRGAQTSGDIDVIITSTSEEVFKRFIDELIKQKIIVEVLSRGPSKCLVMAKIPSSDSVRRVDFLYTTPVEFPFAILYFTGSKYFNTVMRQKAVEMGLTMNEHGIYKLEGKKKGEKVVHKFETEKDIFDYLNMEYKSPEERIDGRAVVTRSVVKPKLKIDTSSDEIIPQPLPAPKKSTMVEKDSKIIIALASNFKKNGITVLEQLNENELSSILREANKAYYNDQPFLSDNQYDIVKEFIEKKYPSAAAIAEIGAPVERNKVQLPYFMGSMDKIKPDTEALKSWQNKFNGPYVLSCKLDGVSGLYTTEGSDPKLYTRGDGKVGQDISHLIPHLRLPKTKGIVIRGEFIIPKAVFETKYKDKFANPRNMVAGIVNHKTISKAVKDLHFVAYEVLKPIKTPSEQMKFLSTLDVECVLYKIETTLSNELLSDTLVEWRQTYSYEIDGVIVTNDKVYERKTGNPDHAFAFKMVLSDQIAEAKVVDVIWTPSKDGYLKPRVQIEPINLGGVRIEYATGFNGAFINDNKIGIGAIIELIRSGDVIPHIRKVTMPAPEAKMPSVPYKWNDTHVDIMLEDIGSDETVKEKLITGFFRGLNVEGLSSGNVKRIIDAGYDTVPKILTMTMEDFLKVEGFKEKTSKKLYDGIREKIEAAPIVTIMAASNIFGRGFSDKKLELILEAYPDVLLSKDPKDQKIIKVAAIKGMAQKTAEAFVERIPEFVQFIKEIHLEKKLSQAPLQKASVDQSHPLYNKSIVMTGFRDQDLQNNLKLIGAKLGSSVSKNTFVVLVKDLEEDTGKALDAKNLGIPLMTPEEFKKKYDM